MSNDRFPKAALRQSPAGKRKKGRANITWWRTGMAELEGMALSWGEASAKARGRDVWNKLIAAICLAGINVELES